MCVMMSVLAKVAEHQFRDHLPDGKLEQVSTDQDVRHKTQSVPTHNKFSETIFGFFDQLVRVRPSSTPLVSEAYIVYTCTFNKTSTWLHSKDDKERQQILNCARANVSKTRLKFKERQQEKAKARRERVEEKMRKQRKSEQRKVAKLEKFTSDIVLYGLWQQQKQVGDELRLIQTVNEQVKALKAQLNFRRYVFKQAGDKSVFAFSKRVKGKTVQLSVDELAINLKTLVRAALEDTSTEPCENVLVGRKVKHLFDVDDGKEWFNGSVISQVFDN